MSCVIGVTGGSGFIGQAVINELTQSGRSVVIIDRAEGVDIRDVLKVEDKLSQCDHVIHLAGILGTEELFENPHDAIDINIKGALNVLLACRKFSIGYTSIQMPYTGWSNVYQSTKLCAMNLAEAYHKHHSIPVSFVRAYNAYGEGQKVYGVQKIVPTFATHAWNNRPIPVWGTGEQKVDMVYYTDIARMLVDAMNYGNCETFDAGTGQAFTVKSIAEMVLNYTGSTGGIEYRKMRKGEVLDGIPPVARGEGWDLLLWKPEFYLETFYKTLDWYRENRK